MSYMYIHVRVVIVSFIHLPYMNISFRQYMNSSIQFVILCSCVRGYICDIFRSHAEHNKIYNHTYYIEKLILSPSFTFLIYDKQHYDVHM